MLLLNISTSLRYTHIRLYEAFVEIYFPFVDYNFRSCNKKLIITSNLKAESREQRAESREQKAESREKKEQRKKA